MASKLKSILFGFLEKALNFLSSLGINKDTPGAFLVYNFLFRHFWPYGNVIEIQGSKMYVNVNDEDYRMRKTFEAYASSLVHEKATTELFKKIVKEGDVVVDLGANIGYFTLLAAKLVGQKGKVYAFEPEPKNYYYLQKNIKLNNYDYVSAFQRAVSDRNGKTKLYICDYDTGHHTINKYNGIKKYSKGRITKEKSIEIETITLDDFLKGKVNQIDVIKMDVEGAEALALTGMDDILKKNKEIKMFVEFFPLLIENMGNSPTEFIRKLLQDYNFSIHVVPDDYDALKGEIMKKKNIDEIMTFRKNKTDHINLFLEKST